MDNGEPTDQELFSEADAPDAEEALKAPTAETTSEADADTPEAEAATAEDAPVVEADAEPAEQSQDSPAQEADAQEEGSEQPKGGVPPHRLREQTDRAKKAEAELEAERKEREALQRRLDRLEDNFHRQQSQPEQKPATTPDFFADPEGAIKRLNETFEQKLTQQAIDFSLKSAHRAYGQEFDEAYNGLMQSNDAAAARAIMQAPDPGEALVIHHRRNKLLQETGGDLDGFTEKLKAELLSDPEFQAKALEAARANASGTNASGTPNLNIPQSVNSGTRAADARPSPLKQMTQKEWFTEATR